MILLKTLFVYIKTLKSSDLTINEIKFLVHLVFPFSPFPFDDGDSTLFNHLILPILCFSFSKLPDVAEFCYFRRILEFFLEAQHNFKKETELTDLATHKLSLKIA